MPLYCSVDIRNSHDKIAVVDTNAFPAGFNNLCPKYCDGLVSAFRDYIDDRHPGTQKVLLVAESHTRNRFYLENVRRIGAALKLGDFDVRIGSLDPEIREDSVRLEAVDGELTVHRVIRDNGKMMAPGFDPDLIVNNNDLSEGVPEVFQNIGQPVIPPRRLGWHKRSKHPPFHIAQRAVRGFRKVYGRAALVRQHLRVAG